MGKLTDEQKAQLEQLQGLADAPDDDDNEDVEWWEEDESGKRRGGRMSWKKGKAVYGTFFPDIFGDKPPEGDPGKAPKAPPSGGGVSSRYFGRGSGTD